jgi:cytochrome c553
MHYGVHNKISQGVRMNRIAKLLGVMALAVPLGAMTGLVSAAEQAPAKADPAKGETLYTQGVPDRNVPACFSCHGTAGNSTAAVNPKLAGQQGDYVHKQLADFKAKSRDNPIMSLYAQALSDQDMKALTWPSSSSSPPRPRTRRRSRKARRSTAGVSPPRACRPVQAATARPAPAFRPSIRVLEASIPSTPKRNWWHSARAPERTIRS